MVEAEFVNQFLDAHLLELVIMGGMIFGFVIIYKKFRPNQTQPDFLKVMSEKNVKDEDLNVIQSLDAKWLYRGEQRLGRILRSDSKKYNYSPTKEEVATKAGIGGWQSEISTIVFRQKDFLGAYLFGQKKVLRFKPSEAQVEGDRLIFASDMGFTALGNEYITKTSFREISTVIESEWSKRLFEANVNVMASKMSHISAETPEMAHELSLKRLDIERIRAEKQQKVGGLI